jgi:Xaa-Pro aminopeptidase
MFANLARLGARMDELGLDGLVATTAENVYYLTGIASVSLEIFPHSGQCYAVVTRDRLASPHFVSSRCDLDQIRDTAVELDGALGFGTFFREFDGTAELSEQDERLRQIMDHDPNPATAADTLVETLRRAGLDTGRVAVDEDGALAGLIDTLREALPGAKFQAGADVFRWTRKVKTEAELLRLASTAAVTERAIRAAVSIAAPGVTEVDLVREFERTVVSEGGRPKFSLIKFGAAAAGGQTRPTTVPLRRGEAIWFDVGIVHEGYWADLGRVFSFGPPSEKLATYYAAVLAGEDAALAAARPGMRGKELFDIAVEAVRAAGIPHYRRNHVGHGIGVEVYDRVLVTPTSDDALEAGTVVNFETPYYEFGFGAAMVEDPFVVRENGTELLTTLDRRLSIID